MMLLLLTILQIVSIDEILRQKSLLDIDKYLPLPELQGNSVLLSEEHINQVSNVICW